MKTDLRATPAFSGGAAITAVAIPQAHHPAILGAANGRERFLLAALLLLTSLPVAAQKASLEGRVVNALSGDALRRVNLTLTRLHGKGDPLTTQTDDKGCFSFADLDAGGYRLRGERTGFLSQEYGARLNPNSGAVLALAKGQAAKDLVFKLAPNATLAGRVLDQDGEAMPNLLISVYKFGYSGGKRQWSSAGSNQTNDRGEFRVSGLRAGHYTIGAVNLNIGIGIAAVSADALPDKPEPAYGSTYLGDAADISQAQAIDLKMGEDHRGADIHLVKTPTVRVRGRVSGAPSGKILAVMAMRKGGVSSESNPGGVGIVQQNDNTFELRGLTPGTYLFEARSATEINASLGPPVAVEVTDQHIEGIVLPIGEGASWNGTVSVTGGAPGAAKGVSVTVALVDYAMPASLHADAAEDGQFHIKGVYPGKYRVMVAGLPDDAYVKSIRLGGQEADETGVEWSGTPPSLEIGVSRTAGQVEGSVAGPDGKPMAGATVVLIPESGRTSLYRNASSDHEGNFTLTRIAPGRYKLLAWEDLEPGAYLDPEFVKPFNSQAQPVTMPENGKIKVTLTAIPFEKVVGSL